MEHRYFELRYSGEGRTLAGVALKYNTEAVLPWGRELFESRAFGDVSLKDVILNVQHLRTVPIARTGGGGLTLFDTNTELTVEAKLPETVAAQDALVNVRAKILRGLSVQFFPVRESFEGSLRRIHEAVLGSISVVDEPQYSDSEVAIRMAAMPARRMMIWL